MKSYIPDEKIDERLPLDQVLQNEKAQQVRKMLTLLSEKQREVLILHHTHGMSLHEIAVLTQNPLGTIKSHLFRGMSRLYRELEKERT